MIRDFLWSDIPAFIEIHKANELPDECLPPFGNPLFIVDRVLIPDALQKPTMGIFVKVTSEVYLLLDHSAGTPQERWEWLKAITKDMRQQAWEKGLEEITAWIPTDLVDSFGPRIEELGFQKSPWQSYTLLV
jgi:hypothetical protein